MGSLTFKLDLFKQNLFELIPRLPDKSSENLEAGAFSYEFDPRDEKEIKKFPVKSEKLNRHLSCFNLDFDESKCMITEENNGPGKLLIRIKTLNN